MTQMRTEGVRAAVPSEINAKLTAVKSDSVTIQSQDGAPGFAKSHSALPLTRNSTVK